MQRRHALGWAVLVVGCSQAQAQPAASGVTAPPAVVALEGAPDGVETQVTLRTLGTGARTVVLGTVHHAEGAARRGAVLRGRDTAHPTVLVTAMTMRAVRASAYGASLFRVDGRTPATIVCDRVADLSVPIETARGTVLVQRGRDGAEPEDNPLRVFRERTDTLELDAVDTGTGRVRNVWHGEGQLAYLATAMRGEEVAVYWVHDGASTLFALDAATGATRTLVQNLPVARDFSYDAVHDTVVFARSTSDPAVYEVAEVSAQGGAVRVRYRGASDHLMPRALHDGTVMVSLPDERGLGVVASASTTPSSPTTGGASGAVSVSATTLAPMGGGSDAVTDESADGRWTVVRHTDTRGERPMLWPRRGGSPIEVTTTAGWIDVIGFVRAGEVR